MAESYQRLGVLDHLHLDARAVDDPGDAGVVLCERRFVGKLNLRGEPTKKFRDAVKRALGFEPPTKPNTSTGTEGRTAFWLCPNEWLIVTPPDGEAETVEALRAALDGQHIAVTDVSEGRTVIGLAGSHARDVLMKGCPLDLHPRVFETGDCAQSHLAKALVILHQTDAAPAYDIYVERSVADYLWTWLEDAAGEYGLAIVRG
ncbi:MAG: sarcosine oxidase subunit gamma [Alphaproteobacteria bacterium]